jgi:hypothetical protein
MGTKLSGDLEVEHFVLQGLEDEGPTRYELTLPPPPLEDENSSSGSAHSYTWCGWDVTGDLELEDGPHTDCYYAGAPCSADLQIER